MYIYVDKKEWWSLWTFQLLAQIVRAVSPGDWGGEGSKDSSHSKMWMIHQEEQMKDFHVTSLESNLSLALFWFLVEDSGGI